MKLEKLSLMGLTAFRGPLEVDFSGLGGLVSISGPNGAGKTTILEAPLVALYRSFPSRPNLYDYCHGRDAYAIATFSHEGHVLESRVLIDAEGRKSEGYLTVDGQPVVSGKAREHLAEVETRFGSAALLLASVFASQERNGDFLRASRADRKALFAELLGLGMMDLLAAAAGDRRGLMRSTLDSLAGQRRDLEERIVAAGEVPLELARSREKYELATHEVSALEDAYREAKAARDRAEEAGRQARLRREQLERWQAEGRRQLEGIAKRRQEASAALERVTRRYEALRDQPDTIPGERQRAMEMLQAEQWRIQTRQEENARLIARADAIRAAATRSGEIHRELRDAEERAHALSEARASVASAEARLEATLKASAHGGGAACFEVNPDLYGRCPLVSNQRRIEEQADEAERVLGVRQDVLTAEGRRSEGKPDPQTLRAEEDRLRPQAILYDSLVRAEREAPTLEKEDEEARRRYTVSMTALEARADIQQKALDAALGDLQEVKTAHVKALVSFDDEEEEVNEALLTVASELAALELPPPLPNVDGPAALLAAAREREKEVLAEISRLEYRLESLKADRTRLDEVKVKTTVSTTEEWEWKVLADGLGRNGAQALEVDAAGPAVAQRANALLDACYGPRFSIGFETLREKRSAKGEFSEVFDIHVYDGGQQRQVEGLSGGEKVIVGEALSLALAIYNAQRSSVRWETLWRDETAGALDPSNAQAYVDMLRRAMELGGFQQVVYVSHVPDVWERADVCLRVEDGRVTS